MFLALIALHIAVAAIVLPLARRAPRAAFGLAAMPPLSAAIWAFTKLHGPTETAEAPAQRIDWVAGLDLGFDLALTPFGALLTVAVGGIGALVMVYAHAYFEGGDAASGRFLATLTLFAASMLGIVWADSVWTLFVFWEATSVTSFLLVGHKHAAESARIAARRALAITGVGGLALLAGLVLLVDAAGTARLSEMSPTNGGTAAGLGAFLVVLGAATKSALVPFHSWLPGAMAAPTPVSAYLHSATMVKAGVILVALVSPVLGGLSSFRVPVLVLGAATIFHGAIGALRQRDAKLILAWGTVSQLGFIVLLLGIGTAKATFAAVAVLAAHAIFKAGLFMVVGAIDVRTGTRDIDQLHGLWRTMPVTAGTALLCAMSMAGVPPLVGFPAKEAAVEAGLGLGGGDTWILFAIVVGSALTVAYTVRFLIGVFGPFGHARGSAPTQVRPARLHLTAPAVLLAGLSLAGFVAAGPAGNVIASAAAHLDPESAIYRLIRWPGLTTAFIVSVGIVAVGIVLGVRAATRLERMPQSLAERTTDRLIDGLLVPARWTTGRVQHGSLPVYVATMATAVCLAAAPFLVTLAGGLPDVRVADSPGQAIAAIGVILAAYGSSRVDSRLGAALALGVVGLAVTGLFVSHGAPDLVLTQLLVETVIVVGFVVGLGRLQRRFPVSTSRWQFTRLAVSVASAVAVAGALLAAGSAAPPAFGTPELVTEAVEVGGGNNIVNVVLTDTRALDTLGEIVVLGVAAIGIIALGRAQLHARDDATESAKAEPISNDSDRQEVPAS